MRRSILILAVITCILGCGYVWLPGGLTVNFPGFSGDPRSQASLESETGLPPGFSIGTYASGIRGARMMRFTSRGDLLVSAPSQGSVFLVEADANRDGTADGVGLLLSELNRPHGLALHDGWLYVAEGDAVSRVSFDAETRAVGARSERIVRGLPEGGHWTRTVAVGPDERLYVTIGSSCNVCIEKDQRRAAMVRYRLDGTEEELYATGLRNAVGFAWRPGTGELFATDNGRDLLGDDFPPCELDRIVAGGFYGWPYANGDRIPDPDFGADNPEKVAASIAPVHDFEAHTAPLGIVFYDGTAFPARYRGAAFVPLHGSWNRSSKSGYKVVALFFDEEGQIHEEDFLTGFEIDEEVTGRPVDVAVGPDDALYVSDDYTGSIYRVAYGAGGQAPVAAKAAADVAVGDPLAALPAEQRRSAASSGAQLWDDNGCAACHVAGKQAKGETYKPIEGMAKKHTLDSLVAFLAAPQPPMPLFPLSDAERRDVAVYVLETYP
jgi:glucose/arabinose dehydrogenase